MRQKSTDSGSGRDTALQNISSDIQRPNQTPQSEVEVHGQINPRLLGAHCADPEAIFGDLQGALLRFRDSVELRGAKAVYDDNSAVSVQATGGLREKVASLPCGVEVAQGLNGKDNFKGGAGLGQVQSGCVAQREHGIAERAGLRAHV